MRIIDVPKPVTVINPATGKGDPKSFSEFVTEALDIHAANGKSPKQMRQVNKIVAALEASNGHCQLEDADYDLVRAAMHIDDEGGQFNPMVGRRCISFFDAIESAQQVNALKKVD